jgi:3-(methylthio)propanoyl-CoA dehydrogenase
MSDYRPPTTDIGWVISQGAGLDEILELGPFVDIDHGSITGLLEEAARFMSGVVAPLSRTGDQVGSVLRDDGVVATPPGYGDAYRRFVEAGWPAAAFPREWGGGGLPLSIGIALQEMLTSADMAFSLCPMLTYSACEMLLAHASEEQKGVFLPKLISGEWTGTMVLTEPQAGSDVGALTTRAVRADDGSYRLTGTKIFITWGEHDLTENIVHIVLARTPGSPPGTKGISCFIVPKFLVGPDRSIGERNDVVCVSIEHKLGIHASPTCVLSFGDGGDGAVGYLVGEEHAGMRYMFTMMNHARLSVGIEGLAVSERAYQLARSYALERRQGRAVGDDDSPSPIVRHPDVRRMLMLMRSNIEAMRSLMYRNAAAIDLSLHHADEQRRRFEAEVAGLLTPLSKAWGTDLGVELTSMGIQIHGGAGYVEETGAAQLWRDSRIAPIYEGTNGIQAIDLVTRKLPLSEGDTVRRLLALAREDCEALDGPLEDIGTHLSSALDATEMATVHLLEAGTADTLAAATSYTRMLATTIGGWLLAVSARRASSRPDGFTPEFLDSKVATARFFAEQVLTTVPGHLAGVLAGADATFGVPEQSL